MPGSNRRPPSVKLVRRWSGWVAVPLAERSSGMGRMRSVRETRRESMPRCKHGHPLLAAATSRDVDEVVDESVETGPDGVVDQLYLFRGDREGR